jgi:hypothetical protein
MSQKKAVSKSIYQVHDIGLDVLLTKHSPFELKQLLTSMSLCQILMNQSLACFLSFFCLFNKFMLFVFTYFDSIYFCLLVVHS